MHGTRRVVQSSSLQQSCRCVEVVQKRWCRGGADEVQRRGCSGGAEVLVVQMRWCRGYEVVQRWCGGGACVCYVQRCAEVQVHMCRDGAEVQVQRWCGGSSPEVRDGAEAVKSWCRGGADAVVQMRWCRGAEVVQR